MAHVARRGRAVIGGSGPRDFVADDIRILLRAMGCDSANGINISGTSTGGFGGGVTISHMRRIRIDHANGAAVRIDGIGDAFEWDHLYSFRADAETGAGVHFTNAVPANAANNHVFINPLCRSLGRVPGGLGRIVTIIKRERIDGQRRGLNGLATNRNRRTVADLCPHGLDSQVAVVCGRSFAR